MNLLIGDSENQRKRFPGAISTEVEFTEIYFASEPTSPILKLSFSPRKAVFRGLALNVKTQSPFGPALFKLSPDPPLPDIAPIMPLISVCRLRANMTTVSTTRTIMQYLSARITVFLCKAQTFLMKTPSVRQVIKLFENRVNGRLLTKFAELPTV